MSHSQLSIPEMGGTLFIHGCHFAYVDAEWSYHKHHHSSFELLHCLDGSAVEWVNGRSIALTAGDWLFLSSGVMHSTITNPQTPFAYFTVHFDMDDIGVREQLGCCDYLHLDPSDSKLLPLLNELEALLPHDCRPKASMNSNAVIAQLSAARKLLIQAVIIRMVSELLDVMEEVKPQKSEQAANLSELNLAHAIEMQLNEAVFTSETIESLAQRLFISRNRYTLLFQKVYGLPPHRYLSLLKMKKAKEWILRSDRSLEEIGDSLGFSCASSFSRQFRRWTGYAPMQFRLKGTRAAQ
jgi:AraC-like DNA-binding protein